MGSKALPEGWEEKPLSKITTLIKRGIAPKYTDIDGIPIINQKCIRDYKLSYEPIRYTDSQQKPIAEEKLLKVGDVLVNSTGVGTLGRVAQILKISTDITVDSHITIVRPDHEIFELEYFGYLLKSKQTLIESLGEGSTGQIELSRVKLGDLTIKFLKDKSKQQKIASILSTLDEKIELNTAMNQTLEAMAQTIFKSWFVDFEPFKEGKFIESELGMIPEGWGTGTFDQIIDNYDSKRIPLSKTEREQRQGKFPYYGASSVIDYIDDYIFDGIYVLVGEDGTVVTDKGTPVLQYVWGKFWVNNHTHILKAKKDFCEEYIYLLLKQTNVISLVTGAVQPKINQKNMNSIKVILPDSNTLKKFTDTIQPLFERIRNNSDETKTLTALRDTLLPKLMSGEARV